MKKEFRSFTSARKFIQKLNLNGWNDWLEYCRSGNRPDDIPASPNKTYKNKGWISYGDFLGTGRIAPQLRTFLPFREARTFVRKLGLKNQNQWNEYRSSGNKSDKIPSDPQSTYKNKGWISYGDFLGTGRIANQGRTYLSFVKTRTFVRKFQFSSRTPWNEYVKSGNKPDNIPSKPERVYKKEWKGWGDFLGTGRIANQDMVYLSAKEAKPVLKKLFKENNIKNHKDWKKFAKTHKKLIQNLRIPYDLFKIYSLENAKKKLKKKSTGKKK